jgi:hypothetical protein
MPTLRPRSGAPRGRSCWFRLRAYGTRAARLSSLESADFLSSRAVFLAKYQGFGAGLQARIAAVLRSLAAFRLGELKYTIAGQKIDGTQE